ncbi:hypothetical protein ACFL1V_01120 [Pseudomonadota bacterium]
MLAIKVSTRLLERALLAIEAAGRVVRERLGMFIASKARSYTVL